MAHTVWLLSLLLSCLVYTALSQVESSSEETEGDADREGKYMNPPFGKFPVDSGPCSSAEPTGITISSVVVEEKDPSNSEISELLQLLREFKKNNLQRHFFDSASAYQPMQPPPPAAHSGEDVTWKHGSMMGYAPFYPYPWPMSPCMTGIYGFGPCNTIQQNNHTSNSRPQNVNQLEQILSTARPSSTATTFGSSFTTPNAAQDPISTSQYPSSSSFLSRPAESFEEVIIQKHQHTTPGYSSWPYSQIEDVVTTERYYLPSSSSRTEDPVSTYNPTSYRNLPTTPITTVEELHHSPTHSTFSPPLTTIEEVPTTYYKTHKTPLLKPAEETSNPHHHHPANHRTYYGESHYPSSHPGSHSSAIITTEEMSSSPYSSRHRPHYSSTQAGAKYHPSTVTTVEETVVEVPVAYTEGYHPSQYTGRYAPSSETLANSGYNRPQYSRYPMYQTNG